MCMEFVISSRFSFEIRFGHKILQICLRQLWWKLDSALISDFVTLQHSRPYSRTDFTLLLYSLIFVFRLYCLDFQMDRNLWKPIKQKSLRHFCFIFMYTIKSDCLLAYACCTLAVHRSLTTVLHLVLFCDIRSTSCQL